MLGGSGDYQDPPGDCRLNGITAPIPDPALRVRNSRLGFTTAEP
jgi:hypothetical protein